MRERSFRKSVVESGFTLPIMSIITLLLWLLESKWDERLWLSLLIVATMTYIIVEWNNQCQLLRIRSRMNSVTFLTLMAMFPALHMAGPKLLPAFCLLVAFYTLFKAYGLYKPEGYVFHSFLALSIGSLYYPPLLLVVPALFLASGVQLRVLTLKSVSATFLGLVLPYWLYASFMFVKTYYIDDTPGVVSNADLAKIFPIVTYLNTDLPDYTVFSQWHWLAVGFVAFLALVSVLHFVSTSYNDKIRTRQYFYALLVTLVPVIFIAAWWPDDIMYTLPLLLLNITPFAAHHLALAKGRLMPYYFWAWLLLAIAIGMINTLKIEMF